MSERIYDPLSVAEQDDLFNQMGKWLRDNPTLPPREFLACEIENLYRMRATIYQMRTTISAGDTAIAQLEQSVLSLCAGSAACDQAADDDEEVIESLEAENKRLLERVRELERTLFEATQKWGWEINDGEKKNKRVEDLADKLAFAEEQFRAVCESRQDIVKTLAAANERASASDEMIAGLRDRVANLEAEIVERVAEKRAANERIAGLEARNEWLSTESVKLADQNIILEGQLASAIGRVTELERKGG